MTLTALEEAGVFCIVLESVPAPLARIITERVGVPTIGIGAGPYCDGQVQVLHDVLGLFSEFVPKHAKAYTHMAEAVTAAVRLYMEEVSSGAFPTPKESYGLNEAAIERIKQLV